MPFSDPEDRYVHVRADRAALAALRAAHPDEYREAYEREDASVRAAMRAKERSRADVRPAAEVPGRDEARGPVDGGAAARRADGPGSPQRGTDAPAAANEHAPAFGQPPGRPTKAARKPPKKAPNLKAEPPPPPPSFVPDAPPEAHPEAVVEYRPDPSVPEDPAQPRCPRCRLGVSRWLACGCGLGELGDDGVPLDPRFAHLGPAE